MCAYVCSGMRNMHARLCVHRPHACRTATMRYNALRCLHAYALFTKARTSCIPSERPIVHYYQAVGTDEGSTPLHCSSLYRMAQCMKAWLGISMFYQFYHSCCWWMENYHKYCYFARPLKANREPRSAYLPDGEAILIMEGILPGWGSCIALCLGWPLRLLQTSVTRPYNFW